MLVSRTTPLTDSEKLSWLKWALATYAGDVKHQQAFWEGIAADQQEVIKVRWMAKAGVYEEVVAKIDDILAKLGE